MEIIRASPGCEGVSGHGGWCDLRGRPVQVARRLHDAVAGVLWGCRRAAAALRHSLALLRETDRLINNSLAGGQRATL